MDFGQGEEIQTELAALRERVATLEREMAELREVRTFSVPPPPRKQAPAASETADAVAAPPPPAKPVPAAQEGRSLEDRLGSQIFNRVGIIALLVGITLFLKWAIDNQWIGPVARVAIGLIAGAGLVLWSERFRRKGYPAFSYSLKAVGSGALYLSLWAAFHLYHLMPAGVALAAMVLVTAWNAFMAWAQDTQALAAYALIGGFATPALLSSGGDHEIFLFSYVLAIDLAVLALVRLKPWGKLLLGSIPATAAYFIAWYWAWWRPEDAGVTALFAGLLFLAIALAPVLAVSASKDWIIGIFTPISGAAFGALAWYSVLENSGHHSWLPWEMVALASFYLVLARLRRGGVVAEAMHLSQAVMFLTIAIPLKASGRWITVGWLAEGVALLWVATRLSDQSSSDDPQSTAGRLLRWLACAALLLGWIGAASLPFWLDLHEQTALWNSRFATELVGVAAMAAAAVMAWRTHHEQAAAAENWVLIAASAMISGNLLALLAGVMEIRTFWGDNGQLAEALSISAFLMVYAAALLAAGFLRRSAFVRWQGLVLVILTIVKVFLYDMRNLSSGYRVLSFIALGALLMAVSFAYQKDWLSLRGNPAVSTEEVSE